MLTEFGTDQNVETAALISADNKLQGDQLKIAVFFWYLVKRDFFLQANF